MIIILSSSATKENLKHVTQMLEERGYGVHLSEGVETTIVGAVGVPNDPSGKAEVMEQFQALPFVDKVVSVSKPYKVVSKQFHPDPTIIDVRGVKIGDPTFVVVMAGPCTVETEEQLMEAARAVKAAGAHILRGGAYKPSTSPYSFHGHGEPALKMLAAAREELDMAIITEVLDVRDVDLVCQYADILQIGTRNMANFPLLTEIGKTQVPVMLKRGMSATIEEWLQAAEYIASRGNKNVMLCERGIRTFETYTRNTFDINAIAAVKELSHLPIIADPSHATGKASLVNAVSRAAIADPSHATGKASLVNAVSRAAIAAGADGIIIEVHPNPEKALKDGAQSLLPEAFITLMHDIAPIAAAVGKHL